MDTHQQILDELKAIRTLLDKTVTRNQLNAVIALLLTLAGKGGREEIVKNRRANKEVVDYLGTSIGLTGKDLGAILNTSDSGISNLRKSKKKSKK